jgi:hypothetical protein
MKGLFILLTAVIAITLVSCTAEIVATRPADILYEPRSLPVPGMCGSVAIGYGKVRVTPGVKDDGTEQEKEGAGTMAIGNLMELAGDGGRGTGKFAH